MLVHIDISVNRIVTLDPVKRSYLHLSECRRPEYFHTALTGSSAHLKLPYGVRELSLVSHILKTWFQSLFVCNRAGETSTSEATDDLSNTLTSHRTWPWKHTGVFFWILVRLSKYSSQSGYKSNRVEWLHCSPYLDRGVQLVFHVELYGYNLYWLCVLHRALPPLIIPSLMPWEWYLPLCFALSKIGSSWLPFFLLVLYLANHPKTWMFYSFLSTE